MARTAARKVIPGSSSLSALRAMTLKSAMSAVESVLSLTLTLRRFFRTEQTTVLGLPGMMT